MSQSDTRAGDIPVLAGEDLTGLNGRLVVLTHDTGVPEVKLPAAVTDLAYYLLVDDGADAELVAVRPFEAGRNVRAVLKGTCNPGDVIVLADTGTAADKGKVRALPAAAGTYRGLGIAEEKGVDGQLVLFRPAMIGNVTVAG
ncbi:MAG TPA: hypothetical protein PKM57_17400 [Kiritimatiellia bacterium]|nr:hypothetical protein [Kiritimatiellia bacterium]